MSIDDQNEASIARQDYLSMLFRMKRISLFGNFGSLNIGNECTLQAIIHNIRRHLPTADINCICTFPNDVEARHSISALPMSRRAGVSSDEGSGESNERFIRRFSRILFKRIPEEFMEWGRARRVLKGRDMLIMTGTGMLGDSGNLFLGMPYEIFKWVIAAKSRRVRVLFVSVGVEHVHQRLTRWFIKLSLALADYISFRDVRSQRLIEDAGSYKTSLVYPDLAFSLPRIITRESAHRDREYLIVGVGLFDYCGRGLGSESDALKYRAYIERMSRLISALSSRGHHVRILIGDIQFDNPVREDLRRSLRSMNFVYDQRGIYDDPINNVSDLFSQIASTDLVIATRFHNVLFSILLDKPVISVSYNPKNDALMSEMGLAEYCFRVNDFHVQEIMKKFDRLQREIVQIKPGMMKKVEAYRNDLDRQYELILERPNPNKITPLS